MHFYFMLRGALQNTAIFKMFMQSQMWIWKRKNLKTGKDEVCQVQGSLRECGFCYEYVIPAECLPELLTVLDLTSGHEQLSGFKALAIRKMLGNGVKPIPKFKKVVTNRFIQQIGIALYPIGIKDDEFTDRDFGEEGEWHQELL